MTNLLLFIVLVFNVASTSVSEVAQSYVADTEERAIEVALEMGFAGKYSHPSNMCGPLTAHILDDVGLLNNVHPNIFWLLNPDRDKDSIKLARAFSKGGVWNFSRELNYEGLQPGDFIYSFAYAFGYEHMMVVTDVINGEPWTVTNIMVNGEWTISHISIVEFFEIERTGSGGYLVIRPLGEK